MEKVTVRKVLLPCVVFVLLSIFWFPALYRGEVIVAGEELAGGDLINHYIPYKHFLQESVRSGTVPFWNPYVFSGRPFQADVQTGMYYPPNWLFLIFPTVFTFTLLSILHLLFTFVGMYYFAGLFLQRFFALVCAFIFVFSAFFITRFFPGTVLNIFAAAWLPWIFYFTERLYRERRYGHIAMTALCVGLQILSGSPQIAFYTLLGAMLYAFVGFLFQRHRERGKTVTLVTRGSSRFITGCALAITGGILLAAVQILPTAEFVNYSFERAGQGRWAFVTDGSLSPGNILTFFVPNLFDNPVELGYYWGGKEGYWEINAYAGVLPLFLLLFAIISPGTLWKRAGPHTRRLLLFSLIAIVLSIALAMGKYSILYKLAYFVIPGCNRFRVPARMIMLYLFCLSMVSGVVLHFVYVSITEASSSDRRRFLLRSVVTWLILVLPAVFGLIFLLRLLNLLGMGQVGALSGGSLSPEMAERFVSVATRALLIYIGIATVILAALCTGLSVRKTEKWCIGIIVATLLFDVWSFGAKFPQFFPSEKIQEKYFPETELTSFFETHKEEGRILALDDVFDWHVDQNQPEIWANRTMMYGLYNARGYDPLLLRWYCKYANVLSGVPAQLPTGAYLKIPLIASPELLSLLNVKYVVTYRELNEPFRLVKRFSFEEFELHIYENPDAKGWAFFMNPFYPGDAQEDLVYNILGGGKMPVGSLAVVDTEMDAMSLTSVSEPGSDGKEAILALGKTCNSFTYEITAEVPRLLVFSQSFYPAWKVRIDNEPVTLVKVNATFPGVYVPQGTHVVQLIYVPKKMYFGGLVSGVTLFFLLTFMVYSTRTRKEEHHTISEVES